MMHGVLAVLLSIGVAGCVGEPASSGMPSTLAPITAVDAAIERTRRGAPLSIILFQTPTECLTCSTDTYRWVELAREAGGELLIVLSEAPTKEETASLKRMRLNFTVLREPLHIGHGVVPPAIAVFRGPDTLILESRLTALRRSELLSSTRRMVQRK